MKTLWTHKFKRINKEDKIVTLDPNNYKGPDAEDNYIADILITRPLISSETPTEEDKKNWNMIQTPGAYPHANKKT